jgi:hypothetical protein
MTQTENSLYVPETVADNGASWGMVQKRTFLGNISPLGADPDRSASGAGLCHDLVGARCYGFIFA